MVSIFIQLYVKFRCVHFASGVANRKKINLANLKHKMNIFALVGLDIMSPLESNNFPASSGWCQSACCGR